MARRGKDNGACKMRETTRKRKRRKRKGRKKKGEEEEEVIVEGSMKGARQAERRG